MSGGKTDGAISTDLFMRNAIPAGVYMASCWGFKPTAQAGPDFSVTNLITNNQALNPAQITDPNLVNPWGVFVRIHDSPLGFQRGNRGFRACMRSAQMIK